jgi:hypothetical protein
MRFWMRWCIFYKSCRVGRMSCTESYRYVTRCLGEPLLERPGSGVRPAHLMWCCLPKRRLGSHFALRPQSTQYFFAPPLRSCTVEV